MTELTKKTLLLVNGQPPKYYPDKLDQYDYIACTDGAYHNYFYNYLTHTNPAYLNIAPHFIIGDFDSLHQQEILHHIQLIHTPDQNKTDFEKALLFLAGKGCNKFDIYGASGNASDHFLGNLSVAMQYYKQLELTFYDHFCRFFFIKPDTIIHNVKDKTISLMPLSKVTDLTIRGFKYPLTDTNLEFGGKTSLRNQASEDTVFIKYGKGDLLVFVSH